MMLARRPAMYLLQLSSHSDMRRRNIKCCFCTFETSESGRQVFFCCLFGFLGMFCSACCYVV